MQGTPDGLWIIETECQPLEALQVQARIIDRHHIVDRDDGRTPHGARHDVVRAMEHVDVGGLRVAVGP